MTEERTYNTQLKAILQSYNDSRLVAMQILAVHIFISFFPIPDDTDAYNFRQNTTVGKSGFTILDEAMRRLYARRDCSWITVTDAVNIYGSEVVERVHLYGHSETNPSILLNPTNSPNFFNKSKIIYYYVKRMLQDIIYKLYILS